MGVLDAIKEYRERKSMQRAKFKDAQEDLKIQRILEERQKSANERELERFHKKWREDKIKEELEEWREQEKNDVYFNHNPLNAQNIVKEGKFKILKQRNLFSNNHSILNQKNIFT